MSKAVLFFSAVLMAVGCERLDTPTSSIAPITYGRSLILNGFNASDTIEVGPDGYRVGKYHDFSAFDSLRINFTALRLNNDAQSIRILVRVGPVNYFSDSLVAREKEISILVNRAYLAKPRASALTFFVPGADGQVVLARLRLFGWGTL